MTDNAETTAQKRLAEIGRATQFQPGNSGRPKGSRNKLQEDFLSDVLAAWEAKGAAAIEDMIAEKPGDFVKMVAGLMPKEATLNINDRSEMTDAELADRIRSLTATLAPFLFDGDGAASAGADGAAGKAITSQVH